MRFVDWLCGVRGSQYRTRSGRRARHRLDIAADVALLETRTLLTGPSIVSVSYDGDPAQSQMMGIVDGNVVGSTDFSSCAYSGFVELDTNADGTAEIAGSVDSNGSFSIGHPLTYGQHTLHVRAVGYDEYAAPVTGNWTSFTVTLAPPSNNPPTVQNLAYTQYSDPMWTGSGTILLTGDIQDDYPGSTFYVEVDTDNDGNMNVTADACGDTIHMDVTLEYGQHTLKVRAKEIDRFTGNTLYGAWVDLSVTVAEPVNNPPTLANLNQQQFSATLGATGRSVDVKGDVIDDGVRYSEYAVEIDMDADGVADFSDIGVINIGAPAPFRVGVGPLPLGSHPAKIRVVELNEQQEPQQGSDWQDITIVASNSPPVFTSQSHTIAVDLSSSFPATRPTANDPEQDELTYTIDAPGVAVNGIDFSITDEQAFRKVVASGLTYTLTATDPFGAQATTNVRFVLAPGSVIYGNTQVSSTMRENTAWADGTGSTVFSELEVTSFYLSAQTAATTGGGSAFIPSTISTNHFSETKTVTEHGDWTISTTVGAPSTPTIPAGATSITVTWQVTIDVMKPDLTTPAVRLIYDHTMTIFADGRVGTGGGIVSVVWHPSINPVSTSKWDWNTMTLIPGTIWYPVNINGYLNYP